MWFLVVIGWLICGILAQGMCRYNYAETISPEKKWGPSSIILMSLTLLGPFSLFVVAMACFADGTWGLKFRYPED